MSIANETRPVLNVPLMEATMGRIIAEPASWDQRLVAMEQPCGTTFCFAGHAALVSGCTFTVGGWFEDAARMPISPMDYARAALGLTYDEAESLFYLFTTDIDVLHRKVKDIIESAQAGE